MEKTALVVQGGTLIDGTGRPPVENAVIVIEQGRFTAVGRKGDIAVPPGAKILDATGRTVLPGYIDGHGHLEDFQGELYLHLGITSVATINIFQDGPWTGAQKRGTALGKIRGPRIWMAGRALGGERCETNVDGMWDPRIDRGNIVLRSAEEARRAVRRKKERDCDIIKLNEFLPPDLIKVVCEEAHGLGMPVIAHSWDAIASARAGVDSIEHIWAVGNSSVLYPPARERLHEDRLAGKIDQEIAMSYYEPENYGPIIEAMVAHGTAWTPTIAKWLRPLSPSAARFRAREAEILDHPKSVLPGSVRAVTEIAYTKLKRYTPEQQERVRIGFDKANTFIRRFVEAGGLLKEGADPPRGLAGLLLHEALVMDVETGVPPMTAIQSVTLNAAKVLKRDTDHGSVESGKVADLVLIEGDPLADIWAMQNVKALIMDGKPVDTSFTGYRNPIPAFYPYQSLPSALDIAPNFVTEGAGPVTLTVRGAGMWPFHRVMLKREFGSLLNLNATELPTRYVSKNVLEAVIAPELLSSAGTYTVTVKAEGEIMPESHRAHLIVGFAQ